MKKIKFYIILSTIAIISILFIIYFKTVKIHNQLLDVSLTDEVYIYQFEEGKGFFENKATSSQKKNIWKFVENLIPTEPLKLELAAGGYSAFYFKNNNNNWITVFTLRKLEDSSFYMNVAKLDVNGNLMNQYYFTTTEDLSNKIPNIIIIK